MHKSINFLDKMAERYSKQPVADEAAHPKKAASHLRGSRLRLWSRRYKIIPAPFLKHNPVGGYLLKED